jgi:two-component system sensor histidine kinase KdpD
MYKRTVRDIVIRVALAAAAVLLITWLAYRLHFNLSSATSIHLLVVTAIAVQWGFLESSIISLLSVVCLDYFFTQPLFKFYMSDSHDWVALITFEGVALVVSRLSNRISLHARESELHRFHLQKLYELSQNILLLDQQKPVDQQLADVIQKTFRLQGVALWNSYGPDLCKSGICNITDDEVRSVYFRESNQDDFVTATSRRVLRSGTRSIGSLFLCGHALDADSINAIASLTAVAIERARSFSAESSAEAARLSEQLRSTVLDSLAHAFKTPLTTIRSSSSGLIEMDTLSGTEKKLVALIDHYANHLNDLTTRLLRTARMDNANLKVKRERIDLIQFLQDSIEEARQELGVHSLNIQPRTIRGTVWADRQLLKMALFQIYDNAAKYGSPGSSIAIDIEEHQAETVISVRNEGSFILPEEREKIFTRFYRSPGSDRRAPGTGIGLSVVKHVTEAHQGRAWVDSDQQRGTTFSLALPRTGKDN